jgi:acetoin utilization deacetylase AcuC-like enzyme
MKILTASTCTDYAHAGHPERPERIQRTVAALQAQKELSIEWLTPEPASGEALLRAHAPEHLARLSVAEDFDEDTPYVAEIDRHARLAAGAAIRAVQLARKGTPVFSLMRPPGHHATRNRAMGFCYLNNVAIAVLEALANGYKQVAVFDFDVHHGNGTEAILLNRPGTRFYSIHQHPCYPGTGTRNAGNNCFNFPLPPRSARLEYRQVLGSALQTLAKTKPDLIAVSAGFDAYTRDPLAQEPLEVEDFYWLGQSLSRLSIPVFSVLEGGYSEDLPQLLLAYLKGLESR